MMSGKFRFAILLVVSAAMFAGGCTQKITVTQYPVFWSEDMKIDSLAVWQFRNGTDFPPAGNVVADKLAAAMGPNGTYKVYNPSDLQAVEGQADLAIAAGDPAAAADAARKFGKVQAIVTGTVTGYKVSTNREQRYRDVPIYGYDQYGNYVVTRYDHVPYWFTRHDAVVDCTATMIRARDGSVVHSTQRTGTFWSQGETPPKGAEECKTLACAEMVAGLVDEFCIVQKVISVKKGETLRTASELYDGKWAWGSSFKATSDEMFVVVKLPSPADRNRFKIVIVPKGERKELAKCDLVWDKANGGGCGYKFSPKQIVAANGGTGKFTVKFYSGQTPVLLTDFSIR